MNPRNKKFNSILKMNYISEIIKKAELSYYLKQYKTSRAFFVQCLVVPSIRTSFSTTNFYTIYKENFSQNIVRHYADKINKYLEKGVLNYKIRKNSYWKVNTLMSSWTYRIYTLLYYLKNEDNTSFVKMVKKLNNIETLRLGQRKKPVEKLNNIETLRLDQRKKLIQLISSDLKINLFELFNDQDKSFLLISGFENETIESSNSLNSEEVNEAIRTSMLEELTSNSFHYPVDNYDEEVMNLTNEVISELQDEYTNAGIDILKDQEECFKGWVEEIERYKKFKLLQKR